MARVSHQVRVAAELAEQAIKFWERRDVNHPLTPGERVRLMEIVETYLRIIYHRAYARGYRRARARHA